MRYISCIATGVVVLLLCGLSCAYVARSRLLQCVNNTWFD